MTTMSRVTHLVSGLARTSYLTSSWNQLALLNHMGPLSRNARTPLGAIAPSCLAGSQ